MKKYFLAILIIMSLAFTGCSLTEKDDKIGDIDFTVITEEEIPQDLLAVIEEKKVSEFTLTYESEGFVYIVRGYGRQQSAGYSMAVKNLFYTSENIYFESELIGPKADADVEKAETYPYIVVKIEKRDEPVIFK